MNDTFDDALAVVPDDDAVQTIPKNNHEKLEAYCVKLEESGCNRCHLGESGRVVVSRGNVQSPLMIIGQNPGAVELKRGLPFVGPAGQLLDELLEESGLAKYDPYFTNVGLCGTEGNRPLNQNEAAKCFLHLQNQIRLLAPLAILSVGMPSINALVPATANMRVGQLVKRPMRYNDTKTDLSIPVRLIYHTAFLLRKRGSDDYDTYRQLNLDIMANLIDDLLAEEERRANAMPF